MHTLAHAHTHAHTDILLNARALLLPQSTEYHICLFTPRFLSLNSINIYIAAEGVGSPSCRGGELSSDENELQSSLPRRRLVCLYLHYPAIPKLPLCHLGSSSFFFFSSSSFQFISPFAPARLLCDSLSFYLSPR